MTADRPAATAFVPEAGRRSSPGRSAPMYLSVDVPGLTADERVLLRVVGADPGSDWLHGFSSGHLYLTDRRLVLEPWSAFGGAGRDRWELPLDAVAKVSSVPVPV